jgi:hypothetical protein
MSYNTLTKLSVAGTFRTLLNLVADEVDWKFVGPASLPHCSLRRNSTEVVANFFTAFGSVEELTVFEPREFIEAGENVTALGYLEGYARDTNQKF